MRNDVGTMLAWALRVQAGRGAHADLARQVVLTVILAQLLGSSHHAGPPHPPRRPPRAAARRRQRRLHRESLTGRRPRG